MANRDVPPLQYARVYQLVKDFPHLEFEINGALSSPNDVKMHLSASEKLKGSNLYLSFKKNIVRAEIPILLQKINDQP